MLPAHRRIYKATSTVVVANGLPFRHHIACRNTPAASVPFVGTNVVRLKHSKRQLKRLFQQHPAAQRVHERQRAARPIENVAATAISPQYPPTHHDIKFLPNGWSAPPPSPPSSSKPDVPFFVQRTANKPNNATGFLPVYSHLRKDGTLTTTRIRKVSGNHGVFVRELAAVLQVPPHQVRQRAGSIEVKGAYVPQVRAWLAGLGF